MAKLLKPELKLNTASLQLKPYYGYWKESKNQKAFLENIATKLNIKTLDDWYSIPSRKCIIDAGGNRLLNMFGSIQNVLKAIYPEYNWDCYKLRKGYRYWHNLSNQKAFFEQLAKKLNIKQHDDWYKVTSRIVCDHGGRGLMGVHKWSLINALKAVYPDYAWKRYNYFLPHQHPAGSKGRLSKAQLLLRQILITLLPDVTIHSNFRHNDVAHKLEFDIFVPEYSLAIEYQGETHYQPITIFGSLKRRQDNDKRKFRLATGIF